MVKVHLGVDILINLDLAASAILKINHYYGTARTTYKTKRIESIAEMMIAIIAAISILFSHRE
jgi:hypothetical protein